MDVIDNRITKLFKTSFQRIVRFSTLSKMFGELCQNWDGFEWQFITISDKFNHVYSKIDGC